MLASNQTTLASTTPITSYDATDVSLAAASLSGLDSSSTAVANGSNSTGQQYEEVHGLETITTASRPGTFVLGSTAAGSPQPIDTSSASTPASPSTALKNNTSNGAVTAPTPPSYPVSLSSSSSSGSGSNNTTGGGTSLVGVALDSSASADYGESLTTYVISTYPTPTVSLETPPPEGPTDGCAATTNSNTVTVWSTIYTTTITWTGNPTDYTPPYPESTELSICSSQATGRLSASVCSDGTCALYTYPATSTSTSQDGHRHISSTATAGTTEAYGSSYMSTITFWTTDKNPAVVYSSSAPPDYGSDDTTAVQDHNTPDGDDSTETPQYGRYTTKGQAAQTTGQAAAQTTTTTAGDHNPPGTSAVTVIVQTTQVIINGETFTDNPQSRTSTVVVGVDTFTINPSQVVGAGATVARPAAGGIFIPTATTTTVGGLQLVYGSTAATIDGTVFTIGATPSTAVVQGQTITIGPGGIAFPSQTIPVIKGAGITESAVLGGELITAIGNSIAVVDGTTFTYGPDSGTTTKVVDGDTILIGPSGIIVHGLTLGGPTASGTATTYEIAGGATITEMGGSAVVIDNTTYLIGAGAASDLTTVIDGQTLTIGPSGVAVSSYTFAQPYVTSTVIQPGATSSVASPTESAESAGRAPLRPSWDLGITGMCIAIGVGFLVGLLC